MIDKQPSTHPSTKGSTSGAMGTRAMIFVVDRLEGDQAVLVGDDDTTFTVPRRQLPIGTREGAIFRIGYDNKGKPDWTTAEPDEAETKKRARETRERR